MPNFTGPMEAHEWRRFFNSLPNMPDPDNPTEPAKPRLRIVLCELSTGRCLADAKLEDLPLLTGDLALLRRTLAHLITILPQAASHE